jgi:hypothetical protein
MSLDRNYRQFYTIIGFRLIALLAIVSFPLSQSAGSESRIKPHSTLSPKKVVEIIMHALKNNDYPVKDNGIKITYNFASPANRTVTGPLSRFNLLIKNKIYVPMINHKSVVYENYSVNGSVAKIDAIIVSSTGKMFGYRFGLSLQLNNEFSGSWMTDSVVSIKIVSL